MLALYRPWRWLFGWRLRLPQAGFSIGVFHQDGTCRHCALAAPTLTLRALYDKTKGFCGRQPLR